MVYDFGGFPREMYSIRYPLRARPSWLAKSTA